MRRTSELLLAARAEALFTSGIPTGAAPDPAEVTEAISTAVRRHSGTRGCAAAVAYAYGERPETAAPRMRWARCTVLACYPGRRRPA
ncbi:MAG TPA: hypothetical protein VNV66_19575 [Pilimelia sp.]|nr:hypothetical protein [Pilimelia sp.]